MAVEVETPPLVLSATVPENVELKIPDTNVPATTTHEEDRTTAGQRRINMIWEFTQASIAILVTLFTLVVAVILTMNTRNEAAILLLSNAFFLIIGTYFTRTNHTKTGGIGAKEGVQR